MDKMKIGDNFWVSEYYTGNDVGDVTQWQVLEIIKDHWLGTLYRAKRLDQKENPHISLFSTTGSPDVMRARVYRTQEELEEYQKYAKDYHKRKELALAAAETIFPEGNWEDIY